MALSSPQDAGPGNFNNVVVQDDVTDSYIVLGGGIAFNKYSSGFGEHDDNQLVIGGSANVSYSLHGDSLFTFYVSDSPRLWYNTSLTLNINR